MPKKLAAIIKSLRQIAARLNIQRGHLSGAEARQASDDLSQQIEKLEALGKLPNTIATEEPPNQPPPSGP